MKFTAGKYITKFVVTAVLSILVVTPFNHSRAGEFAAGEEEYRNSCLNCHGVGARGDGPLAEFLNVKPPDLTQIKKKNGGEFPLYRIVRIIDGRATVRVHGDSAMPVWGSRYRDETYEKIGIPGSENYIRGRILSLAYYLESLQQD